MSSLDSIKENIYSIVVKAGGRATVDKILKWAEENNIGVLVTALAVRELEREKRIKTVGDARTVLSWSLESDTYRISLPAVIETVHVTKTHKTKTKTGGVLISELLGIEDKAKRQRRQQTKTKSTTTHVHTVTHQAQATTLTLETPKEEKERTTKTEEEKKTKREQQKTETPPSRSSETKLQQEVSATDSLSLIVRNATRILSTEYGLDENTAERIIRGILQYLSINWSVGELRLRLDLSKTLSKKLNMNEDELFEIVGRALRVLRKMDVIEIVEPGVVNLLRRDLVQPQKITFSEVLGL